MTVSGTTRWIRAVFGLSFLSSIPLLHVLGSSRSSDGAVLGMWSPVLAILILMVILWMVFSLLTAFGAFRLHLSSSRFFQAFPELSGPVMLFVLPGTVFLFWFLSGSQIFSKPSFALSSFVLSSVPGLLVIFSRSGKPLKSILQGTAVMAFALAIVILAGELVMRAIMPEQIFNPRFGLRPYSRTELQVDLPGIDPGGTLSTNMWGFRGDDPPDEWDDWLTMVTIGGSTTANYYLDDSLTWSSVMQQELRKRTPRVWVGNAGIPRHSSDTHLLFLREVISEIHPDMAIFLVGVNDMGPFLRPGSHVERLPDTGPRQWLFANSSILQLIYKAKKVYVDRAQVINSAVDPYFTEEPMTTDDIPLPEDLHELLEDPDFYRNRITLLIDECESQGVIPVFLTQPLLYEDSPYWRSVMENSVFFQGTERPVSAAAFSLMLKTLNEDLVDVCEARGVAVYDLASDIPHQREYFYDAMHMTEAGADLVGRMVAGFILEYSEGEDFPWPED